MDTPQTTENTTPDLKTERKAKVKEGMTKIKDLVLQLLTGSIVADIGDALDKNITNKEERQNALNEAERIYNERLKMLYQLTNQDGDSWLSKNVRPMMIILYSTTTSYILLFNPEVDPVLLGKYLTWNGIMVSFYFGAREVVKAIKRKKNS